MLTQQLIKLQVINNVLPFLNAFLNPLEEAVKDNFTNIFKYVNSCYFDVEDSIADDADKLPPPPAVSHTKAAEAIKKVQQYFAAQSNSQQQHIDLLS